MIKKFDFNLNVKVENIVCSHRVPYNCEADRKAGPGGVFPRQEGITSFKDRQGNTVFFRRQHHNYIHRTMPGRDLYRPKVKVCGSY